MKKVDLFLNIQVNKVCSIVAIVLISFFITACAGKKVSKPGIEYYRDSQQKWLASLKEGMSLEEALNQKALNQLFYQSYFFQCKYKGHLFQYSAGKYRETGMLFGLLFKDGKLTSLLLDQAVVDFNVCQENQEKQVEDSQYQLGNSWHTIDFEKTISWIREQNRLGDEYHDVSIEYQPEGDVTGAIIEGVLWAPLAIGVGPGILLTKPFMPKDKSENYTQSEHLHELSNIIELEVTTSTELIKLLGKPDIKNEITGIWRWNSYGFIKVGIVEGTVYWSESENGYWYNPRNNKTIYKTNYRCVPSN